MSKPPPKPPRPQSTVSQPTVSKSRNPFDDGPPMNPFDDDEDTNENLPPTVTTQAPGPVLSPTNHKAPEDFPSVLVIQPRRYDEEEEEYDVDRGSPKSQSDERLVRFGISEKASNKLDVSSHSVQSMPQAARNQSKRVRRDDSDIYSLTTISDPWLVVTIIIHCVQWGLLLAAGSKALPDAALAILVIMMVAVVLLLLYARYNVKKRRHHYKLQYKNELTPEDEADEVPEKSVYLLISATILEGCMFSVYTAVTAGLYQNKFGTVGFFTQYTMLQTLRFASITFLAFHRIIRPANRVDPLGTILELEIVSVCWDALDGSTLFELLQHVTLSPDMDNSVRFLMAFWYLTIGFRVALTYCTSLSPQTSIYKYIFNAPLELAPQPTVDRTLSALKVRSLIIMISCFPESYAAITRIILWGNGKLDQLQQDMALKNFLFVLSIYDAYNLWMSAEKRWWNSRELFLDYELPSREFQLEFFRWSFAVTYILIGILMSMILVHVSEEKDRWVTNVGWDIVCVVIFLVYCRRVHVQDGATIPRMFFLPQRSFVLFPGKLGIVISCMLFFNMFSARLPAIYLHQDDMADPASGQLWTYDNAILVVVMSIFPIAFMGSFWSVAYLLFRKEFTACPGNYNAIHDPIIRMVTSATTTEGALDILSCATLMQLAVENLDPQVDGAIILFCCLECFNACQCFAFQTLLSGGHEDTPLHLVRWKAYLRVARGLIDFGAFILRLVLWLRYNVLSSVFLIKNLYNLIHTFTQIERFLGTQHYPKHTLFTTEVNPQDWYGLTKDEWRIQTSNTVITQARAGRAV